MRTYKFEITLGSTAPANNWLKETWLEIIIYKDGEGSQNECLSWEEAWH